MGPQGLTVLYVDDGRRDTVASMQQRIQAEGLNFPIFHDTSATTTSAYAVRAFPTAYLLDREGRVVWEGIPVYDPAATEQAIRDALAR
jgi:hypothetical protein